MVDEGIHHLVVAGAAGGAESPRHKRSRAPAPPSARPSAPSTGTAWSPRSRCDRRAALRSRPSRGGRRSGARRRARSRRARTPPATPAAGSARSSCRAAGRRDTRAAPPSRAADRPAPAPPSSAPCLASCGLRCRSRYARPSRRTSSRRMPCLRVVSWSEIIGSHWKGVKGLGQKVETPTLISRPRVELLAPPQRLRAERNDGAHVLVALAWAGRS